MPEVGLAAKAGTGVGTVLQANPITTQACAGSTSLIPPRTLGVLKHLRR